MRGAGDVAENVLSYISPLGLVLRSEVYVSNYLWPILVTAAISLVGIVLAFYLNSIRDLGAGLIAAKPGRKEASRFLGTPFGLTFRLLKFMLIVWAITIFILGASYGSVFGDIDSFLEGNEMLQQMFLTSGGFSVDEQFLSTIVAMYAILLAIPILLILLKIYTEEKKGRLETIYAKKVSRKKMLGSYFLISFVSSIVFTLLFTFGLWIAAFSVMTTPILLTTVLLAGLVYLPAIWFTIGLTVLLVGFAPKLTKLVWAFIGASFVLVYLGPILQLPTWAMKLTPFGHIPRYPIETVTATPLIVLTVLAAVMCIAGFYGYKRRDLS